MSRNRYVLTPAAAALRALVMWLAVIALLSGCELRDRWVLEQPDFYPTALDYWPQGKVFVVGSYHDGTIKHLAADGGYAFNPYQGVRGDGRRKAVRLKVDQARDRLWVLDLDAVYVYTLGEQKPLQRIELPAAALSRTACLPDMALDPATGAVYVSHNQHSSLYRIEAQRGRGHYRWVRMDVRDAAGKAIGDGFSALVLLGKPRALIAGSAETGRLWRIDPETGVASAISNDAFKGICGMAAHPHDAPPPYHQFGSSIIYASMGFEGEVLKITFAPDWKGFRAARIAPFMPVHSPISLVAFSKYIVVTSSQLSWHRDINDGESRVAEPFRLVLMPSGLESMMEIRSYR